MPLPSELPFTAFLKYSPRGTNTTSRQSREFVLALKSDSVGLTRGGLQRIIPYSAHRLAEELEKSSVLKACFEPPVIAVPVPRSAPLVTGGLWPALKLCEALRDEGLVSDVHPLLERRTAVQKSATAGAGRRPTPEVHYDTFAVTAARPLFPSNGHFVIVDDVVTRGATFLASYARLREAFPEAPISCFAFVRTMSGVEIDSVVDPVAGIISTTAGYLHREP